VFVGDSHTHGAACSNYIDMMPAAGVDGYDLVNAGVNRHLAFNVAIRLDEIIACEPDVVIVLIGTNDANSRMSAENQERVIREQELPQVPDAAWYRNNLTTIAERLLRETDARIAFLSLPTMGEDLTHPAYLMSRDYSRIVKEVAETTGITYIPLHETMVTYLERNPGAQFYDFSETRSLLAKAVLRHYILGQSWNEIGESNGFVLHIDHLHMNDRAAEIAAGLIADFVHEGEE
jgi:lysophospholipase L1-like esterase